MEEDDLYSLWRTISEQATSNNHEEEVTQEQVIWQELQLVGDQQRRSPLLKDYTPLEGPVLKGKWASEKVQQSGVFFGLSLFLTTLLLTFPQVESVLPIIVIDKWSPCLYLNPWSFPSYFQSLCLSEKGQWESWVGLKQPTEFNLPQFPSRQDQYWKEILPVLIWT